MVPLSRRRSTPVLSPTTTYIASTVAAAELIVIDVLTEPRSIPSNSTSMSARLSTATPARPTSPTASGWSESRASSVGMSNAVDKPLPPAANSCRNRSLVSSAVPKPANCRMVHNFDRYIDAYGPRVYGYSPGNSASSGP